MLQVGMIVKNSHLGSLGTQFLTPIKVLKKERGRTAFVLPPMREWRQLYGKNDIRNYGITLERNAFRVEDSALGAPPCL